MDNAGWHQDPHPAQINPAPADNKPFHTYMQGAIMSRVKTNALIFLRNLKHSKGIFMVTVLGLAAGLMCTLIVAMLVQSELRYDTFHKNITTLYQVYLSMNTEDGLWTGNPLPGAVAPHLKNNYPEVRRASNYMPNEGKIQREDHTFITQYAFVDSDFFSMFSFDILSGKSGNLLTDNNACVLEEKMAQKLFGETNPIGQTITMWGSKQFRIDAIISIPSHSSLHFEILLPYAMLRPALKDWKSCCTSVFVQLNDGASADDLAPKIIKDYQIHAGVNEAEETIDLKLHPFSDYHLYVPGTHSGRITFLYAFLALGLFILIMGCFNFINLSTARASTRAREIGMKKTMGASPLQISMQFLGESWALTFAALVLALVGTALILPFINNLLGEQGQLSLNWPIVALLPIILFVTGLMAGTYPALILSRVSILSSIKGVQNVGGTSKKGGIRKALVMVQFAFTIVFMIGIYTVYRQTNYLTNRPLGFTKDYILVLPTNSAKMDEKYEVVKATLLSNPLFTAVTRAETSFVGQQSSAPISWKGHPENSPFTVDINDVDSQYAEFFGLEVTKGRFFREGNTLDQNESFVLNESAVAAMGLVDPIGLQIVFSPGNTDMKREGTVIGVVKDYHTESLHSPIRPKILAMGKPSSWYWYIRFKPNASDDVLVDAQKIIQPLLPSELLQFSFLDDKLKSQYSLEQTIGKLLTFLTVISIILAGVGLFSLGAFFVDRKQKEIGIRKTLGASSGQIARSFILYHIKGVIWAFIVVAPLSWYAVQKLLGLYAYQFGMTIWGILLTGLMVLALAVVSIAFQAFTASSLKPVNVLCRE